MEGKKFIYVENIQIVLMDLEKGLAALYEADNIPN